MKNKLIIMLALIAFSISSCQSNEKTEKKDQDSNTQINNNGQETMVSDITVSDNLVYREYSLGEKFHPGEITISREILLNTVNEPKTVVVYFNDKILETIDYNNEDIQINLEDEGMYCFVIIDKNKESTDITSHIQGTSYLKDEAVSIR